MRTEQFRCDCSARCCPPTTGSLGDAAQLVLVFAGRSVLKKEGCLEAIVNAYPNARIFGCSTAGEILDTRVTDDSLAATAIAFDHTKIAASCVSINEVGSSFEAGERLARSLDQNGLVHAFVLSDGLGVNGSDLVRGVTENLPEGVSLTGGLSGDGAEFEETFVVFDGAVLKDSIAILGFYGDRLDVGYASLGGWDPFGPDRLITRSEGNVLYELDGRSALELYKQYLGDHAAGLPATGLLFPLCLRAKDGGAGVVRTILSVCEESQSVTYAGDVPCGTYGRLMKANFDHLVDGALDAARVSHEAIGCENPDLAILISCVGRKLVLKQRVEEEIEAVREVVGDSTVLTGFYSYGEVSPFKPGAECELHNQTMTITMFRER